MPIGQDKKPSLSSREQDVVWSTALTDLETKRPEVCDGEEGDKDRVGLDPGWICANQSTHMGLGKEPQRNLMLGLPSRTFTILWFCPNPPHPLSL